MKRMLIALALVVGSSQAMFAQDNPPVPTPRPEPPAAQSGADGGAEAMPEMAPVTPSAEPAQNDPNATHYTIIGLAPDDLLNLRASASASGMTIGRLEAGAMVKNLGCAEVGKYRWCKVGDLDNPKVQGWAAARYLQPTEVEEPTTPVDGQTAPSDEVQSGEPEPQPATPQTPPPAAN